MYLQSQVEGHVCLFKRHLNLFQTIDEYVEHVGQNLSLIYDAEKTFELNEC